MGQTNLPDSLQTRPRLKPGMFASPRPSMVPLSHLDTATLAQIMGMPASPAQAVQPQQARSRQDGMAEGAATRAAAVGVRSDAARMAYERRVAALSPADTLARSAIKAEARAATPPEVLALIRGWRPNLGPLAGSGGRANMSNAGVNQLARNLGRFGRGAGIIGTALALDDILSSPDHKRALVANLGAGVGGFLGGAGGAIAGAATGPAAPVLAPAGGLAGSVAGGRLGYKAGEDIYDRLSNW